MNFSFARHAFNSLSIGRSNRGKEVVRVAPLYLSILNLCSTALHPILCTQGKSEHLPVCSEIEMEDVRVAGCLAFSLFS